jgi:hypothetical protein
VHVIMRGIGGTSPVLLSLNASTSHKRQGSAAATRLTSDSQPKQDGPNHHHASESLSMGYLAAGEFQNGKIQAFALGKRLCSV